MKHVLSVLAFSLLLVGWSPPANAVLGWFKAEVIRAGVDGDGAVFIRLNNPAFPGKTFSVSNQVSKEMLAIGLTAIAGNLPVRVRTDPDESGLPRIRVMYLEID